MKIISRNFVYVIQEEDKFSCLRFKFVSQSESEVKFADVYAVNFIGWGLVHESSLGSAERSVSVHSLEVAHFTNLSH